MFKIFKIANRKRTTFLQIPKLNYCDLRRTGSSIPFLSVFIDESLKYGNLAKQCPIEPDIMFMKDYPLERFPLVSFFPIGSYYITIQISDENGKAITIWRIDANFRRI
jgi:hypothetical protein